MCKCTRARAPIPRDQSEYPKFCRRFTDKKLDTHIQNLGQFLDTQPCDSPARLLCLYFWIRTYVAILHFWIRLDTFGYVWIRLDTIGLILIHLGPFCWIRTFSGYVWIRLDTLGYAWIHLGKQHKMHIFFGYVWIRLDTLSWVWKRIRTARMSSEERINEFLERPNALPEGPRSGSLNLSK